MAQWSRADRTLYTKLVYYGPAYGGKTTNLESLHRITDPDERSKLLSLSTANDRTLFFDLLPFDLGDILGYQVAMKVYTVPGQVRYDTTRQVVLGGADAIVFVADSSVDRREQNVWSLQNLKMNMRAKRLDPRRVPVLFQFNKQDLPDAAPPAQVAGWLGLPVERGQPAVAIEGRGVLETFEAASQAMLRRLVAQASQRSRKEVDLAEVDRHVERAFAPHRERLKQGSFRGEPVVPAPAGPEEVELPAVIEGEELLEESVETSVRLGERLATESSRASRLEREAETYRRLSSSLAVIGSTLDRDRVLGAGLDAVDGILEASIVSLVQETSPGSFETVLVSGADRDPLTGLEGGRSLLRRLMAAEGPCLIDELDGSCREEGDAALRGALAVPLTLDARRGLLVAYTGAMDPAFEATDARFVATVASQLTNALEKVALYRRLETRSDDLQHVVTARDEQLARARKDMRQIESVKDRFLSSLTDEMKAPLQAILGSARAIRDFESTESERRELVCSILRAGELLDERLEGLLRVANLESSVAPLDVEECDPDLLVEGAVDRSGRSGIRPRIERPESPFHCDRESVERALAHLIDNAVKFQPSSAVTRVDVAPVESAAGPAVRFSVLDRGPGVATPDLARIFEPFEQGRDPVTGNRPSGIGIGLFEARMTAERHGGTLEALPREGGGSEFRLVLPLDPPREDEDTDNATPDVAEEARV